MTTVLKLGGSVITAKDDLETVDDEGMETVLDAVGAFEGDLVVVHGGGSFGHHHAAEHGVSSTSGIHDAAGAVAVHGAMKRLNDEVVTRLHERGVGAVPVHPLSAASRAADGALALPTAQVGTMLGEGFTPVLHGDVVAHEGEGVTVVSGDDLVIALARSLDATRVGLCSAVPGVLDVDGEVVTRIDRFDDVARAVGGSDATDVTGGMAAKVRKLLALDTPAHVFDASSVGEFLDGGEPGTRIEHESES
ncbi:isopentenyl phosphate kinase [Haloarculaceae archaeon H-GB1-1]|nr:isopentenyl phosphate kinase [Haloarculaceae archaeon H-GB1-1]